MNGSTVGDIDTSGQVSGQCQSSRVVDRVRRPVHDRVLPDQQRRGEDHEQHGVARLAAPPDDEDRHQDDHHHDGADLVERDPVVEPEQGIDRALAAALDRRVPDPIGPDPAAGGDGDADQRGGRRAAVQRCAPG